MPAGILLFSILLFLWVTLFTQGTARAATSAGAFSLLFLFDHVDRHRAEQDRKTDANGNGAKIIVQP